MFDNIVLMTKNYIRNNLNALIILDELEVDAGNLEPWSDTNYLFEMEAKFGLSVGLEYRGKLVGYRIMSGKGKFDNFAHGHRINVHRQFRKMKIAKSLIDVTHEIANRAGYIGVTNYIHNSNFVSLKFFQKYGYIKKRVEHNKTLLSYAF